MHLPSWLSSLLKVFLAGLLAACGHFRSDPPAYTEYFFFADQLIPTGLK